MVRILFVAVLCAHVCVSAQEPARIDVNPFANDAFWGLHTGWERHVANVEKAKSTNPVEAIEANFAIGAKQGAVRAARGLLIATPAEFARGARLLIEHSHDLNDDGTLMNREFLDFVGEARQRVASFTRDDGAEAASAMLTLEYIADRGNEVAHKQRIQAFMTKYAGTQPAAAMRIGQVTADRFDRDFAGQLRRYRELAKEYDGTETGAMALHVLGARQANCCHTGSDQIERLIEVFDIVKELESGRFPRGEWVERAPLLVHDFFFSPNTELPPASMPVLYTKYLEFVLAHPTIRPLTADPEGLDWIIRNGVARLAPTPIQRVSIVEEFIEDLEKRGFAVNTGRFLRAGFYLSLTDPGWISDHLKGGLEIKEAEARAVRNLKTIIESGDASASARARTMIAQHHFVSKRYADARSWLLQVAEPYPTADWNWVPALRLAQIYERLGGKSALTHYEAVAERSNLPRVAIVLSRIAAAELREEQRELAAAQAHYQAALAAWPQSLDRIALNAGVADEDVERPMFARFSNLARAEVVTRFERLAKTVSTEEALLYEGRRAIEINKPRDAIAPLQKLIASYPKSNAAIDGRRVLRRAQLADILTAPQETATADRNLAALGSGAYHSVTTLSKLARAALKVRTNAAGDAESLVKQALEEWHTKQSTTVDVSTALAQDVAAIRAELFRPQGGGVYGKRGWNAFEWPQAIPPFAIVSRDIQIKTSDGKEQRVSASFAAKMDARVLFASYEDLASMRMILDKIGGIDVAEWVNATDVPNQPIGDSVKIAQLWSRFFPLRPGHWGGWELTIYPYVTKITFDRDNHALAEFTAGYSGGTVELEKENGVWVAKRIVNIWIT